MTGLQTLTMFKNSLRTLFEKAVQNLLQKLLTISIITPTRMLGRERDAEHWGNSQHTASTVLLGDLSLERR